MTGLLFLLAAREQLEKEGQPTVFGVELTIGWPLILLHVFFARLVAGDLFFKKDG